MFLFNLAEAIQSCTPILTTADTSETQVRHQDDCRAARASAEQAKRGHQRAVNRLSRVEEALEAAESELKEYADKLPATEKAIEDTQTALNEAQTALPPLRDAAESQQRKVLAMTQEHHDAQAEARLANRVHERAKKLLAAKQKWHQSLLDRGSELSKVRRC